MLAEDTAKLLSRRQFFSRTAGTVSAGLGAAALASLLPKAAVAGDSVADATGSIASLVGAGRPGVLAEPHFAPRAKRVIYLFMSGGPSQIDLFDYKPQLKKVHGQELPGSVRMGQRVTGMTAGQKSFPCVAPMFQFSQHGQSGTWISELLPHTATIVDRIAIIKSLNTEAINHDPATTYLQTGHQQPGRPSFGAWRAACSMLKWPLRLARTYSSGCSIE